ncbi:MAG: LLM class flavin-dependent oxidoreductase [Rhizobium sp.]|nr:LLM class flavin-dependent oxidoreductase [Rhizobium sp.]
MRLSVLDQSLVCAGQMSAQAIRDSVALARACEGFGYRRYWVSEHHGNSAMAGSAPEVLLGALAIATRTMRIGSAGVMLPHYAPLKVAEQFRVLEALAPGRIDLGLGRGPGADRQTAYALRPDALDNPVSMSAMDSFPANVEDTLALVRGEPLGDDHVFAGVFAQPQGPTAPQPWIVGSGKYSARLAGHLGLPFCHAHFFGNDSEAGQAIGAYRAGFRASSTLTEPLVGLCLIAMAAPTSAEAERLFLSYVPWRLSRDAGRMVPLQPPEQAVAAAVGLDRDTIQRLRKTAVFGTPDEVFARIAGLKTGYEIDEMVILAPAYELSDRIASYDLIAGINQTQTTDGRPDRASEFWL